MTREQVYIANVIKCRPPANESLSRGDPGLPTYLDRQVELIGPRVIVTLGRYSMARYFPDAKISAVHGKPRKIGGVLYYPMFHPPPRCISPSTARQS